MIEKNDLNWGGITYLSKMIPCQRSHISRVLKGELHLTPDQAIAVTRVLKLSEDAKEFFILQVEFERAGTNELREYLSKKIQSLRQKHQNLSNRMERKLSLVSEREAIYFSNWAWSAVHLATSIPSVKTAKEIATKLSLPIHLVEEVLLKLKEFDLVKKENGKWYFGGGSVHFPRDSALMKFYLTNWRQKAMDAMSFSDLNQVHFTNIQTVSRQDVDVLRERILNLVDEYKAISDPSSPEEMVCLNIDFFGIESKRT